jgi:uncharacterized membrane protein YkvI
VRIRKIDWQIAAAYVGTVIGAGFASGQELMQFFVRFGHLGLWGAAITGFLFSLLGGITVLMTQIYGFRTYKDLLELKLGTKMTAIIDSLIMIFLFLGLSVMLSGSGALFKEHLGMPALAGVMITEALVFLALIARDEGVLWFNSILMPILVAILVIVIADGIAGTPAAGTERTFDPFAGSLVSNSWLLSAFLYISYNMISAVVVLVALTANNRNCSIKGGVFGGIILFVLALGSVTALLWAGSGIFSYQIPMLYLAYQVNPLVFYLYGTVLWGAMITTAIANAYGLCNRLQFAWEMPYFLVVLMVMVFVIPFSLFDFAQLVSKVYPIFGYTSLIITFVLVGEVLLIIKQFFGNFLKRLT